VVYRTARCGLRVTRAQRSRLFGLLRSAGDVWCCVLELSSWRRRRRDVPLAGYQELCRELTLAGPGTFGELDTVGARSVLRRYSDAWFATAKRRKAGDMTARYPRRKRGLVPVRWYAGTFTLDGRVLRLPTARGCPPLVVRLDRDVPYPADQVRSVTLGFDAGRLYLDVTAEVPVATYPEGTGPDPGRVAGVDLGIIHPYAAAGPGGEQLLVSGRAIRAECRQHLRDRKGRSRAAAPRAPKRGQRGSRRWRQHRRAERAAEARHRRRVRQAQHEAAKAVVAWAVEQRAGTLAVGDPRNVLNLAAGRVHNKRVRDWRLGHLIRILRDKAEAAGITVKLVDERGTSSTCPACARRVPKPAGRNFTCPHCGHTGHRDLVAAANIAARNGGGTIPATTTGGPGIMHRRAGKHLPGVHPARRDPRRRPPSRTAPRGHLAGTGPPRTATAARGVARPTARSPQARRDNLANLRTSAHYMMAGKGRLFGDEATASAIAAAPHPGAAKALGRAVAGFDEGEWARRRFDIVVAGNLAKFGQHDELRRFLLGTGDRVLVEAAPNDRVWGIGLTAGDERAAAPEHWLGLNLLGFALMEVRHRLRSLRPAD
jgi:IS605 OrfB family transposase